MAKGNGTTKSVGSGGASASRTTASLPHLLADYPVISQALESAGITSSLYYDPDGAAIVETTKGNWTLYYNGRRVKTIKKEMLNESELRASGKLLRNTPDVFQYKDNAFSYAQKAEKILHVMEVGHKYWVVTPADATRLEKGGYRYAKR